MRPGWRGRTTIRDAKLMSVALRPSRFRLLGRFCVEGPSGPLPDGVLGNRKARLLLKALVARRGRHLSMDSIIDVLWDGVGPAKAVENVASLVSRLRTILGADLIEGGRSGYRLVLPSGCTVDVDDAERLVAEAESRLDAGQPALAVTAAAQAMELLAAGDPLEEEPVGGEWVEELRRELGQLVRRARAASWRATSAVGEHRRALHIAQAAVATDPLDEEAQRAVLAAYHRLGESGEALAAYERLRRVLVEQLGANPSPETEVVYLAVLRGDPLPEDLASREAQHRPSGMTGRDGELAVLAQCWESASRGAASCVLVTGETGIGKTTLVEAFLDDVRVSGAAVAQSRCYEAEESLFLQPVVEALRGLIGALPPDLVRDAAAGLVGPLTNLMPEMALIVGSTEYVPTSAQMERRRTFEALASFVTAISKRRPLLVFVDDLHNAGASTVELLHFVLRWDRSARVLIIATVTEDRAGPVELHLGQQVVRIQLGPLSDSAVAQLARQAGRPELGAELARRTRGHTLFVREALQAMSDDDGEVRIPDSLRHAIVTRVSRCGRPVEDFLRGAVIAGATFEIEHVAELLGISSEEAVRRAETAHKAGLLSDAGTGFEFANDMIRTVLYETTPAPTRVTRHRRLAVVSADQPGAAAEHANHIGVESRSTEETAATLRVAMLGPLEVHRDGVRVEPTSPKQRALLIDLLIHRGETIGRDRLIDDLWGEHPPATAPGVVQNYVSQLRRGLGAETVRSAAQGYALAPEQVSVDVDEFEAHLARASAAREAGESAAVGQATTDALALWRGDPLADVAFEPFARAEISRLNELRAVTLELHLEAMVSGGGHREAVARLEAAVTQHPLHERLWWLLMLVLYRSGRQADALRAYQRARSVLGDELGLDPGTELRDLERAILGQSRDLDDLLVSTTPRRRTHRARPRTSLLGRQKEWSAIETFLAGTDEPAHGLLMLVGEPGIGKTRLLEEAHVHVQSGGGTVIAGRGIRGRTRTALRRVERRPAGRDAP